MPENDARQLKVFVCHAKEDKPTVRELSRKLTADGFDVWLDETKLLPGHNWRAEISKGLESADVVIACLSNRSVKKEGYVQKELRYALELADDKPANTIFLIPIRLDGCDIPDQLADIHYVDLYQTDGYKKILYSLIARAEALDIKIPDRPATVEPLASLERVEERILENKAEYWTKLSGDLIVGNTVQVSGPEGIIIGKRSAVRDGRLRNMLDITKLDHQKVASRKHALVVSEENSFFISDLGSLTGTFLNGVRIPAGSRVQLSDVSLIELGAQVLIMFLTYPGGAMLIPVQKKPLSSEESSEL